MMSKLHPISRAEKVDVPQEEGPTPDVECGKHECCLLD